MSSVITRYLETKLKAKIGMGRMSIEEALNHPDAQSISIYDLLSAQRHWTSIRTKTWLSRARIVSKARVSDLTKEERTVIIVGTRVSNG